MGATSTKAHAQKRKTAKHENKDARNALLCKTELGRKQVGGLQDKTDFEDWLEAQYSTRSRTKLTLEQLADVVEKLAAAGAVFEKKSKGERPHHPRMRADFIEIPQDAPFAALKRQICVIWRKLGYDLTKLETRVRRQFKVDSFMWLHDEAGLKALLHDLKKRERSFDSKKAEA